MFSYLLHALFSHLLNISFCSIELEYERESLVELSRRLRRKYTVPSGEENWHPTSKYSLRGIVVSPDKFYFCRRETKPQPQSGDGEPVEGDDHAEAEVEGKGKEKKTEEDVEAVPTPSLSTTAGVDQWWMVSYNARDATPITVVVSTLSFHVQLLFIVYHRVLTILHRKRL